MLSMSADGSAMHPDLARAVVSLQMCPADDVTGESPHARMKHIQGRSRSATWTWHAASDRLHQNLTDIEHLQPLIEPSTDYQWLWDHWSAVRSGSEGSESSGR